jgi:hypothetical protein
MKKSLKNDQKSIWNNRKRVKNLTNSPDALQNGIFFWTRPIGYMVFYFFFNWDVVLGTQEFHQKSVKKTSNNPLFLDIPKLTLSFLNRGNFKNIVKIIENKLQMLLK